MNGEEGYKGPPADRGRATARPPADFAQAYREAAAEFRRALDLLERLAGEQREGTRRRELYRSLRRRVRRGFRRLQEARRGGELARRAADMAAAREGDPKKNTAAEAEELFKRVVLAGGEGLLEQEESRGDVRDRVAGALSAALRTYLQPDDRYRPFIEPERLPEWLQRLLHIFFPVLLGVRTSRDPRTGDPLPTGIDSPEEEEVRQTSFIRLPLSQARELLAQEVIPELQRRLHSGGTEDDRQALERARERLAELEGIKVEPRAKPFVPERGFYTEQITRFSPQGELLVSLQLPGVIRSGTNLDRVRELVKMELVGRLAGKGVCRELDEHLEYIRSLASGSRGSWFFPRSKMEIEQSFACLRSSFPVLAALDSREGTRRLLQGTAEALLRGGREMVRRRARALLDTDLLPGGDENSSGRSGASRESGEEDGEN